MRRLLLKSLLAGLVTIVAASGGLVAGAVTDRPPVVASDTAALHVEEITTGVATAALDELPPAPPATEPEPDDESADSHGQAVSEVAHDDTLEGCEKGRAVSEVASSKAAEHREGDGHEAKACPSGDDVPPVAAPPDDPPSAPPVPDHAAANRSEDDDANGSDDDDSEEPESNGDSEDGDSHDGDSHEGGSDDQDAGSGAEQAAGPRDGDSGRPEKSAKD